MKLGIAVSNLTPSQLNYSFIRNANAKLVSSSGLDIFAFYENVSRECLPMTFAAMQIGEAWGFDGTVVTTTLNTTNKLLQFPCPTKKLFYVWDLEWLRFSRKGYRDLHRIYAHPSLELIARGPDHARAIEQAWNRPVKAIIPDFDFDELISAIKE